MLSNFIKAMKTRDVRKKIIFTLLILVVYKVLTFVTIPLINIDIYESTQLDGGILDFANMLSGGALKQFSVIALGVSPYITASIVTQLLQMDIVPKLAEWAKEGETGKQKINQLNRYLALVLAFFQAIAMAIGFNINSGGVLLHESSWLAYVYIGIVMTGGTALLLWIADQLTLKGIGNGTSMIIMAGIVAGFPDMIRDLSHTYLMDVVDEKYKYVFNFGEYSIFLGIILLMILIVVAVIFMQQSVRKIPIQYANRPNSAQFRGKQDSHIPIRLNSAGVIPVIFAASLLSLPQTIIPLIQNPSIQSAMSRIFDYTQPIGFVLYVVLIYLFSFFYSFVQVSPEKVSDNLKKQGSYVPGIRPGRETENYLSKVLLRTTVLGSTYLVIIAILPILFAIFTNLPRSVQIGGTSLLIVVGVALETSKQIETKTMQQNYRGFIKY